MKRYLLERVLAALDVAVKQNNIYDALALMPEIEAELAKPEIEPVGRVHVDNSWCGQGDMSAELYDSTGLEDGVKLYTSPPDTDRRLHETSMAANKFRYQRDELRERIKNGIRMQARDRGAFSSTVIVAEPVHLDPGNATLILDEEVEL